MRSMSALVFMNRHIKSQECFIQSFDSSTFSGCVKVPALQGVLGSHSLTDLSQLPVTMTLTSGQYSTQRMGASCVPTIVSTHKGDKYGP